MLQSLINQFMQELDIDNSVLTSDEASHVYTLRLEGSLKITITPLPPEGVTFTCVFASYATGGNEEALTTQMLMANLFGQGTRGAILGLTEDGANFLLTKPVDYSINYKEFKDSIEDMINTVDFWIAELPKYEVPKK